MQFRSSMHSRLWGESCGRDANNKKAAVTMGLPDARPSLRSGNRGRQCPRPDDVSSHIYKWHLKAGFNGVHSRSRRPLLGPARTSSLSARRETAPRPTPAKPSGVSTSGAHLKLRLCSRHTSDLFGNYCFVYCYYSLVTRRRFHIARGRLKFRRIMCKRSSVCAEVDGLWRWRDVCASLN